MKKILPGVFIFTLLSLSLFPQEYFVLKDEEDYLEKLTDNEVYFGIIRDIEYDNGLLYFLDFKYCKVIVVDFKSGKLKRTLFSRGQGPYELMNPMSLKVKNNKIFVLDQGFNGIKIVDLDGKPVNEFKTAGMVGRRNIDINDKDEIFVGEYNTPGKTYVSVYDLKGQKQRSIIKIAPGDKLPLQRIDYKIMLDQAGNILVLFVAPRELMKFNTKGEFTWEIKIKNKILDKWPNEDGVRVSSEGAINVRSSLFDMIRIKNNKILLGHIYGGCIIDENGKLTTLIESKSAHNIQMVEVIDDQLINVLVFGNYIYLYNIKEVLK